MRKFRRDHSQRCGDPERNRGEEGGGDYHSVHKVVEGISDQDKRSGVPMHFARAIVVVTPENELFQHEKQHHATSTVDVTANAGASFRPAGIMPGNAAPGLEPYRKFAELIDSHWEGIASYCHPEKKIRLGLAEGVNNKIRVLQQRAYGYRDENYLKLKFVALFLPPLPRNTNINPHVSA